MDGLDEDPRRKAAMRAKKRREGRSRRESASKDYFWIYVACFYLGAKGLALPVIPIGTACGFMIFTKLPRPAPDRGRRPRPRADHDPG